MPLNSHRAFLSEIVGRSSQLSMLENTVQYEPEWKHPCTAAISIAKAAVGRISWFVGRRWNSLKRKRLGMVKALRVIHGAADRTNYRCRHWWT